MVTTKNHNTVLAFAVAADDSLSAAPTVNVSAGSVPFAFLFDDAGQLRLLEATGVSATVGPGAIDPATSNDGECLYVQNGAEASIHIDRVNDDGSLEPLGEQTGLPRFDGHSAGGNVGA